MVTLSTNPDDLISYATDMLTAGNTWETVAQQVAPLAVPDIAFGNWAETTGIGPNYNNVQKVFAALSQGGHGVLHTGADDLSTVAMNYHTTDRNNATAVTGTTTTTP